MIVKPKGLLKIFRHLSEHPKLTVALATLLIPIYFMSVATRSVDNAAGQFVFVVTGLASLFFAGWLVREFNVDSSND